MQPFYLTTAISYTNGSPHIGHAYEIIIADFLARTQRNNNKDVHFLTGTDEHGQKIADTAKQQNIQPIELCNKYVEEFKNLYDRLDISNDAFIRTTDDVHKKTAQDVWNSAKEDIYIGNYSGWYNKREEKFVTEKEAKELNYTDNGVPLIKTQEESYFFKMSKYQDQLIQYINNNPDYIYPPEKRQEILERLKEPLLDLSISRTSFDWGIPIDEKHVMYVWFDALTNYLSGIANKPNHWPAIHLIGKDIVWFHAVIWSCILFSINKPLPKQIICHGFINDKDGHKMSKSWNNVVSPIEALQKYSSDTIRYYLIKETIFGNDLSYSVAHLEDLYNSDLANGFGNYAQRCLSFAIKFCNGVVPNAVAVNKLNVGLFVNTFINFVESYQFTLAIQLVFDGIAIMNKYLDVTKPWTITEDDKRNVIIKTLLEFLYIATCLLEPVIPDSCSVIFTRLNTNKVMYNSLSWNNLLAGTVINPGNALFPRIGDNRQNKKLSKQSK